MGLCKLIIWFQVWSRGAIRKKPPALQACLVKRCLTFACLYCLNWKWELSHFWLVTASTSKNTAPASEPPSPPAPAPFLLLSSLLLSFVIFCCSCSWSPSNMPLCCSWFSWHFLGSASGTLQLRLLGPTGRIRAIDDLDKSTAQRSGWNVGPLDPWTLGLDMNPSAPICRCGAKKLCKPSIRHRLAWKIKDLKKNNIETYMKSLKTAYLVFVTSINWVNENKKCDTTLTLA